MMTNSSLVSQITKASMRATLGGVLTVGARQRLKCVFKVIDGSLYRSRTGCKPTKPNWQLLSGLMVSAVARAATRPTAIPLPDVELRLHQGASALAPGTPALSWCAPRPNVLALPSPYEADCVYHHRYVFTLAHHKRMIASGSAPPPENYPWVDRIAKAVWRGTCTGRGVSQRARLNVARLSKAHPTLVDMALFPCGVCASLLRSQPSLFGGERQGLAQAEYAKYKYVLDLDGDGCSGRLGKLFTTGAVVLKPWTAGYPFLYSALEPWVHYVPVRSDLSDLVKRVAWLQEHDDDAARIGRAAAEWARTNLSPEAIDAYVEALIRAAAEMDDGGQRAHRRRDGVRADPTDDELIYDVGRPRRYTHLNATDHKGRPLDIVCPAAEAAAPLLAVSDSAALVRQYYESAEAALDVARRGGDLRHYKRPN